MRKVAREERSKKEEKGWIGRERPGQEGLLKALLRNAKGPRSQNHSVQRAFLTGKADRRGRRSQTKRLISR